MLNQLILSQYILIKLLNFDEENPYIMPKWVVMLLYENKNTFKRLKLDSTKTSLRAPDYEAIFSTKNGDFYAIGWLNETSDLSLTIEKIDLDKENFKNKFFIKIC